MGSMSGVADSVFGQAVDVSKDYASYVGDRVKQNLGKVSENVSTVANNVSKAGKMAMDYSQSLFGKKTETAKSDDVKQEFKDISGQNGAEKADSALRARAKDYLSRKAEEAQKEKEEGDDDFSDDIALKYHQNNIEAMNNMLQKGLQVQGNER